MNGQAGKGDKSRVRNLKRYGTNYSQIQWPSKEGKATPAPKRYRVVVRGVKTGS